MIRFNIRYLFIVATALAIALGVIGYRATQQKLAVHQLLNHRPAAVQFADGRIFRID
ncbi:MAG: hypothetical protein R3C03_12300 [Pirellulaceae bacterium]